MTTFEARWALARQIPRGQVATYGQLARMLGNPRMSRVVGFAMHDCPPDVPAHRVVNRLGECSDCFAPFGRETHRMLLAMEDIPFRADGRIDLDRCRWQGNTQESCD